MPAWDEVDPAEAQMLVWRVRELLQKLSEPEEWPTKRNRILIMGYMVENDEKAVRNFIMNMRRVAYPSRSSGIY